MCKRRAKKLPNLFQLVSFVLSASQVSIPGSNAFPARIFSLMNSKWRCDRNRMSVPFVNAELQVFTMMLLQIPLQSLLPCSHCNTQITHLDFHNSKLITFTRGLRDFRYNNWVIGLRNDVNVNMFKNTFQSGFLSILYSIGSKPLQIWDKKVIIDL